MQNSIEVNKARYRVGVLVLSTHFTAILLYVAFGLIYLEQLAPTAQGVLSLTPITALYAIAFMRYVGLHAQNKISDIGQALPITAFRVQFIVCSLFCITLVLGIILLFEFAWYDRENISIFTGLLETVFGGFLAVIFGSLFPKEVLIDPNIQGTSTASN